MVLLGVGGKDEGLMESLRVVGGPGDRPGAGSVSIIGVNAKAVGKPQVDRDEKLVHPITPNREHKYTNRIIFN